MQVVLFGFADALEALEEVVVQHARAHRRVVGDVAEHGNVRKAHHGVGEDRAGVDHLQHARGHDARATRFGLGRQTQTNHTQFVQFFVGTAGEGNHVVDDLAVKFFVTVVRLQENVGQHARARLHQF